jgi:hypothetical protein
MSTCATSAPIDLVTSGTNSDAEIEDTLVASYPVTVNSAPPPQEPGKRAPAQRPGALQHLTGRSDGLTPQLRAV